MQASPGQADSAEPPGAASEAAIVQAAVEQYVELHGTGEAPEPAAFVVRFPEQVRARVLAQITEFLRFDGLLGHQEWEPQAASQPAGRTFGDFVIQEELGRGGMGVVYLAHQKSLNRRVALKVMASGLTLSKRHVERFRREALAAAQLRHPAIVPVHSFTEVDGTFALAMDFVAGRNLADVLDDLRLRNGEQPGVLEGTLGIAPEKGYVAECAMFCAQLASALAAAHQQGVVHRDLKPRNLMIDDRRQARLLDFGLAKSLGEGSISLSGEITGTAHYMSPEQTLAKRVTVDHRADIWALGVILYELLTLKRPFDGKNLQQVVYEICFKEPAPIGKHNPKVPRDLVTICGKALEKDPTNRYQSAHEFEADLVRFLRWEPIHARPAGLFGRAAKWMHRHRTESLLAAGVAVLAVTALGWAWYDATATAQRADAELQLAETADARGDHQAAIRHATEALRLRDDAATVKSIELYRSNELVAEKKVEVDTALAATLSLRSNQAIERDRELAVILALGAVDRRPAVDSRSAVLAALGGAYRTTVLGGHAGQVWCARWSPDGSRIVTTGRDGTVVLWEAATGAPLATLRDHALPVVDAAFAPEGGRFATAGADACVRVWRNGDGAPLGTWRHESAVDLVRFDGRGVRALTVSNNPKANQGRFRAQVWDVATGACLATCAEHGQPVVAAAISPCGTYVASGGDRGFVRLWEAATGRELARLSGYEDRERAIAFAPDGTLVAVAAVDGGVRVYGVPSGTLQCTVRHARTVRSVAFDAETTRLLTGSDDQSARLWRLQRDLAAGTCSAVEAQLFTGHAGAVQHAAFDPTGNLVVTSSHDGVVRVFDASSGRATSGTELARYELGPMVEYAAFDASARRVLALAGKQRAVLWDFVEARGVATLRQPGKVPAACFDDTGDRVVTAGDDERVRLWNAHDGRLAWATERLGNPVTAVDVDKDGERIVYGTASSSSGGATIKSRLGVLRLRDGEELFRLDGHDDQAPIETARFGAGGTRILAAGGQRASVWNANDHSLVLTIGRPTGIAAADLAPDGSLLATVERGEKVVRLWSMPDGGPRGEVAGHDEPLTAVQFHPLDGKSLLTASLDGTARVTALDGRAIATFTVGRNKPLQHAAWSRDGVFVLTSARGDSHQARLWRAADGSEELRFRAHTNTVAGNAFSRDGRWALTASLDGTARVWPTDPVAIARRLPVRSLTAAERSTYGLDRQTTSR